MYRNKLVPLLLLAALAAYGGCQKNNETVAPGPDAGDGGTLADVESSDVPVDGADAEVAPPELGQRTPFARQPGVSADGASDIASTLSGEARAGRYATQTDFTGIWSHCKDGDFKLYNGMVEACVSNEQSNRYETFKGGGLVDIRPVGVAGDDVFDLYAAKIGFNTLHADTVEVTRDGSDGGPAVIRASGTDMGAAYFVGVAGPQLFEPKRLDVSVEYRLGPESDFVEIVTFIENNSGVPVEVQRGDLLAFGDRTRVFREKIGFNTDSEPFHWIAAVGEAMAFAWVAPDEELFSLSAVVGDPPWEITQANGLVLQDGEAVEHFGRLVVRPEGLDEVLVRARELLEREVGSEQTVTVSDPDGRPVAGRRVVAVDAEEQPFTGGRTDDTGAVTLRLPPDFAIYVDSVPGQAPNVPGAPGVTELTVPPSGFIDVAATVGGNETVASVRLRGPASVDFASWNTVEPLEVAPGTWRVEIGKGPEYDFVVTDVMVAPGETSTVDVELQRTFDTTDWIAGDFHQHMEPSSDSEVTVEDRVLDNAAEGVEFVAPTDHDVATNLVPYIDELGLGQEMSTFPGVELSPSLSHTNVYPIPYDATKPGRGTVPISTVEDGEPRRLSLSEIIAAARAMPTDPVVQLNHPRDSSGLFDLVDFDPELGPDAVERDWFSTDFDAMETVNGDECQQFADLSGLWNAGFEYTPIGSSDSHDKWGQVGEDRTYLHLPGVAPGQVQQDAVRDVVKAGKVVVASSAFLEFTDGTLPGDTLDGSGGTLEVPIRVQSATWAAITELQVVVNGTITQTIPVTSASSTVDYEGTISIDFTEDSWFIIVASGPSPQGEYRPSGKIAYAFNSPIRVDFDGGGYQPPGLRALDVANTAFCR